MFGESLIRTNRIAPIDFIKIDSLVREELNNDRVFRYRSKSKINLSCQLATTIIVTVSVKFPNVM